MIVIVHAFQIGTILFEQDQQIFIFAYKMLRYLWWVCLTKIEAVDVRVSHCKVLSYLASLACYVIKDKDGIRKRLAIFRNDVAVIVNVK